jgi:hypothetical protein
MRGAVVAMIASRMAASWLLLSCVVLTIFVTASLIAAFAAFESQALPQALYRRLAADPASSVTVIGLVDAQLARTDTGVVSSALRTAFGSSSGQLDESVWSDPMALPPSAGGLSGRQADIAAPDRIRTYCHSGRRQLARAAEARTADFGGDSGRARRPPARQAWHCRHAARAHGDERSQLRIRNRARQPLSSVR